MLIQLLADYIDKCVKESRKDIRNYLGASRLGVTCDKALWYEFNKKPKDKELKGRVIRIFELGNEIEELIINWLRRSGFTVEEGQKELNYRGIIKGHVDAIITKVPEEFKEIIPVPSILEIKSANNNEFSKLYNFGLKRFSSVYWTQIQVYMGLSGILNSVHITMNKDNCELYLEQPEYDPVLTYKSLERGISITLANSCNKQFPNSNGSNCTFCNWKETCKNS